jgi:serine/threonine protein kinase
MNIIILPYYKYGTLYDYLYYKEKRNITEEQYKKFAKDIFNCISFLHENKIQHQDIRYNNFLIGEKKLILFDFDYSCYFEKKGNLYFTSKNDIKMFGNLLENLCEKKENSFKDIILELKKSEKKNINDYKNNDKFKFFFK